MNIVDFLCSFASECVNMVVIYNLYALKLKPWLRFQVFFATQLGHRNCLATIAFILYN